VKKKFIREEGKENQQGGGGGGEIEEFLLGGTRKTLQKDPGTQFLLPK